jgi:serine/threonine protein kinase
MDPAYFMTNNFTDKSDVYSFGIVLLELITGRMPIMNGKNIVTEMNEALEGGTVASMVDPCMGASYPADGLDRLLKLALSCCQDEYDARPYMIDVTRELEDIWRLMPASYSIPLNKGSDSPSVDFRSIDIAGHSSQTSRVYNAQDMSYLSVEHVDSSEQTHPRLWPR